MAEENYFETNVKILKFGGLWYSEKQETFRDYMYLTYTILALITIFLFFTPSELCSLYEFKNDIKPFMDNLAIVSSHVVAAVKIFNFILKRKKIKEVIDALLKEPLEYDVGDFKIRDVLMESKRNSYKYTLLFFISVEVVLWLNYSTAIFNLVFFGDSYISVDKFGNRYFCKKLPFHSWFPFDHSTKPTCLLAIFLQFLILNVLALMIIGFDTLFMSLTNLVVGHLRILYQGFKLIPERCLYKKKNIDPAINFDDEMYREMKKCVNHLNNIQQIYMSLEEIYQHTTMVQVFTSLCVTCACMFLLATVDEVKASDNRNI